MNDNVYTLLVTIAICIFVFGTVHSCFAPYDSTDQPNKRSGLVLSIDALTQCQYLSKPFGGLTPRLDADGTHICYPTENQTP